MKRYYIIYEGIVQGVGFRWTLMNYAKELNLTGYVRNLSNGNVEAEIQGEKIDEFIKKSLSNKGFAKVYDYSLKEIPIKEENKFEVKF